MMIESEWLASKDPEKMLRFLLNSSRIARQSDSARFCVPQHAESVGQMIGISNRKLRLYAIAICRLIWELLRDGRSRDAIQYAERYADDLVDSEQLDTASHSAWEAADALRPTVAHEYSSVVGAMRMPDKTWYWAARAAAETLVPDAGDAALRTEAAIARTGVEWAACAIEPTKAVVAAIGANTRARQLRDIFGNPFRRVSIDQRWKTKEIVSLARSIYDHRDFERLPEMAEELRNAGCIDEEVWRHCRSPLHARGCWLVDVILGKS